MRPEGQALIGSNRPTIVLENVQPVIQGRGIRRLHRQAMVESRDRGVAGNAEPARQIRIQRQIGIVLIWVALS